MVRLIPILVGCLVLANLSAAQADPITVPPPAPAGLEANYNTTTQALELTWDYAMAATFHIYRNGDLLATQTEATYVDTAYGSFNLYWITAETSNGTSRPSSPIGYITCPNPADCAPEAGPQAAAWTSYSVVSVESGLVICRIAAVHLTPFGYIVYWDCIRGIIHRFLPISPICSLQIYGGPPPLGPGQWCI